MKLRLGFREAAQKVYINKDQCFDGISKEVWQYRIGAYQIMEKYLKDRKGRKLSLDEINHYMKVARAIRLTIGLQERLIVNVPKLTNQSHSLRLEFWHDYAIIELIERKCNILP